MDSDNLVAAIAVVCIFGAPIAAWIVSRVLSHQERMEMMRRGFAPPPDPRAMKKAMKYGWTAGSGTQPSQYVYDADYYSAQRQLRRGISVAFIGLALLIGLSFIGSHDGRFVYGPWLLGGLIPMFVGLAQVVSAVLAGARFGVPTGSQSFGPPPGGTASMPGAPAGSAGPQPDSYGGWRPGATPEIQKPGSPPDYRG
jgi:hypothetical protein